MKEKTEMDVARHLSSSELSSLYLQTINKTNHFINSRMARFNAYISLGYFKSMGFVEGFLVNKFHPDGREYHCITSEGIIFIFNENTLRLITIKGARGGQLSRYYKELGETPDDSMKDLIRMAYERERTEPIHEL